MAQAAPPSNLPLSDDGLSSSDSASSPTSGSSSPSTPPAPPTVPSGGVGLVPGGAVPGGGVDAPDPFASPDSFSGSSPDSSSASIAKPNDIDSGGVTKSGGFGEAADATFSPPGGVAANNSTGFTSPTDTAGGGQEFGVPQSTPLAPDVFRDGEGPRRGSRRLLVLVAGFVILLLFVVIGVVGARFYFSDNTPDGVPAEAVQSEGATESTDAVTTDVVDSGETVTPVSTSGDLFDETIPDTSTDTGASGLTESEPVQVDDENTISVEEAVLDADADGLTAAEEGFYGTDPEVADTDSDGYNDGEEVRAGFNPLGPDKLDSDGDGFPDPDERDFGTDPFNPDTDADGFSDGAEINNGYNPLIPSPGDKL